MKNKKTEEIFIGPSSDNIYASRHNIFVNDSFNWLSANYKLEYGEDDYMLNKIKKESFWLPEDSSSLYKMNSMGYRSDEFIENRDMVFSGCSQTFGTGILNEGIWGNILSKKIGIKSYNLGRGGASTQYIVQNLIGFFKEYGNPKYLFCLFPEFTRSQMKSDIDFMRSSRESRIPLSGRQSYMLLRLLHSDENVKYSASPHFAEDMIPPEFIFSMTLDYIRMLEIYCDLNNITLRWGTWDPAQDLYLTKNIKNMDFKYYVPLGMNKWKRDSSDKGQSYLISDLDKSCHSALRDAYGRNFDEAMDLNLKNNQWGHIPIHVQSHIAEDFERSLYYDNN